jgi:hypothetical protein
MEFREVFRPAMPSGFLYDLGSTSGLFRRKTARTHRENPETFRLGILLPNSIDFQSFHAGCVDFSHRFRQDSLISGHRNLDREMYAKQASLNELGRNS